MLSWWWKIVEDQVWDCLSCFTIYGLNMTINFMPGWTHKPAILAYTWDSHLIYSYLFYKHQLIFFVITPYMVFSNIAIYIYLTTWNHRNYHIKQSILSKMFTVGIPHHLQGWDRGCPAKRARVGPFWQDTLEIWDVFLKQELSLMHSQLFFSTGYSGRFQQVAQVSNKETIMLCLVGPSWAESTILITNGQWYSKCFLSTGALKDILQKEMFLMPCISKLYLSIMWELCTDQRLN